MPKETKRATTPVKLIYTGPCSGQYAPEINVSFERDKEATVPKWFADEKTRQLPESWALPGTAKKRGE